MQIIVCKDCEKTLEYKDYYKIVKLYGICSSCKEKQIKESKNIKVAISKA